MRLFYLAALCLIFAAFFSFLAVMAALFNPPAAAMLILFGSDLCGLAFSLLNICLLVRYWPQINKWLKENPN